MMEEVESMRAMFVGGALFGLMWSGLLVGCTTDEEEPDPEPLTYGNFAPDHIVAVDLTMAESDWDAMRNESRSFFSEFLGDCRAQPFSGDYTTFSADLTMDGESLSNIGIRKKGFIGSQSTEKPSLKLNLDEYVAGAELFGTDNITLNNAVQDPSLIRQCLSYDLLRKAGLAAPRASVDAAKATPPPPPRHAPCAGGRPPCCSSAEPLWHYTPGHN